MMSVSRPLVVASAPGASSTCAVALVWGPELRLARSDPAGLQEPSELSVVPSFEVTLIPSSQGDCVRELGAWIFVRGEVLEGLTENGLL